MNWNNSQRAPLPPKADSLKDVPTKPGSAVPPACPRCELAKVQFAKAMRNYQRAYAKKIDGLKTELKSTRYHNDALQTRVKKLERNLFHIPSLILGATAALVARRVGSWLRSRRTGRSTPKFALQDESVVTEAGSIQRKEEPDTSVVECSSSDQDVGSAGA